MLGADQCREGLHIRHQAAWQHALQIPLLSAPHDIAQADAKACQTCCGPLGQPKDGMISLGLPGQSDLHLEAHLPSRFYSWILRT